MHIHIVGIAGTMTAPLAACLKQQGCRVTGSDQENIYPPISHILENSGITLNTQSINNDIDLAIIGSSYKSFKKTSEEFEAIKSQKIPYISATEYVAQNVCRNNSILVAGTYGKTTITSLIAWIMINANLNPNYMFGGQAKNAIPSLLINKTDWSVTEADESINGLDYQAKFLYYPLKYLLLTSAGWEHKESYKTSDDNKQAFINLASKIPKDGILVLNSNGINTKEIKKYCQAKTVFYNSSTSPYHIKTIKKQGIKKTITISTPTGEFAFNTGLLGQFNYENILAASTMCLELGISADIIKKSISSYKGIKRRMEFLGESNNISFFDDFAQSAPRIQAALNGLKDEFPDSEIKVFYEPHASYILDSKNLSSLKVAFESSSEIIIGKVNYNQKISKENRLTGKLLIDTIGTKAKYLPLYDQIFDYYTQTLKPNSVLVHMSSGGFIGQKTFKGIINYFKNVKIYS